MIKIEDLHGGRYILHPVRSHVAKRSTLKRTVFLHFCQAYPAILNGVYKDLEFVTLLFLIALW